MSAQAQPKIRYTFGALTLTYSSLGVPFLSDKTLEKLDAMSAAELEAINREAWKQKRTAARLTHRHCNWSVGGNISIYEDAAHHCMVAEKVCKETYKRMMRRAA